MPAKTVEDLIAFNEQAPKKLRVGIKISAEENFVIATYCLLNSGESISTQNDTNRAIYYGASKNDYEWHKKYGQETENSVAVIRYKEPESKKRLFPWGYASCKRNTKKDQFNCHNAWIIGLTRAAKGYGPMLYDCLLVKLSDAGFGLVSDRDGVSINAANVWANYFINRTDVIKKPLDLNNSTPETEDDCYEEHSQDTDWNSWLKDPTKAENESEEEYKNKKDKYENMRKAIGHAYFNNGIETLEKLRKAKLIYSENNIPITEHLESLYSSLINEIKK